MYIAAVREKLEFQVARIMKYYFLQARLKYVEAGMFDNS